MFLVFDTETTGLPKIENAPLTDFDNWPRMVQLAWQIHDEKGRFVENHNYLVQPDGFVIPIDAKMVHGISTEHAMKYGKPLNEVLDLCWAASFCAAVARIPCAAGKSSTPARRRRLSSASSPAAKEASSSYRVWESSITCCLARTSTRPITPVPMLRPPRASSSN